MTNHGVDEGFHQNLQVSRESFRTCEVSNPDLKKSLVEETQRRLVFDPNLYEQLTDRKGRPRLYRARHMLLDPENLEDLGFESFEDVLAFGEELFSYWRDLSEFILLRKRWVGKGEKKDEYLAVKCSKRGNDVYQKRIKLRLGWLNREVEDKKFFEIKSFQVDKAVKTSLLWVTLTWDPGQGDLLFAWENLGKDFNRFVSALRRKYGRVSYLRVWESYESGFPHVHAVMFFEEAEFTVFQHRDQEGKLTFRIHKKNEISDLWHSHVDIQAISSLSNVFTYLKKHQEKVILGLSGSIQDPESIEDTRVGFDLENVKGLRTLFLSWLFRKRSFSVSGDFREKLLDLISHLHNSNMKKDQVDLFGELVKEWEYLFLGVFLGSELGIPGGIWVKALEGVQVSKLLDLRRDFIND
jgi:hypothetical protein